MNWRLVLFSSIQPGFLVRKNLRELFRLAAQAFDAEAPDIRRCSVEEAVDCFARFTTVEAERLLRQSPEHQRRTRENLYSNAYQFGGRIRRLFRVRSLEEAMSACAVLYRILRIQFAGTREGEITIHHCSFSNFYTAHICELISSMDAGIIAGLAGGGTLTFSQRITEGGSCCKARLVFTGERG